MCSASINPCFSGRWTMGNFSSLSITARFLSVFASNRWFFMNISCLSTVFKLLCGWLCRQRVNAPGCLLLFGMLCMLGFVGILQLFHTCSILVCALNMVLVWVFVGVGHVRFGLSRGISYGAFYEVTYFGFLSSISFLISFDDSCNLIIDIFLVVYSLF